MAGPTYGAADDRGGNRQAALPNGVPLRLQSPRTRQRVPGNSVDGTAAELVDIGATGPGATNASDRGRLGVEGQQYQQPPPPTQSPQQPQQMPQPQQASAEARQQQTTEAVTIPPRALPQQSQGLPQQNASTMLPSLGPLAEEVQSRAHESVVRRELVHEVHVQQVEPTRAR